MIKFGTGGWRAIIADEFTFQNIRLVAQAVAIDVKNRGKEDKPIIIGYDNRFLSDTAAKLCCEVLGANDLKVLLINKQAPTPLIMYTVKKYEAVYGLAITASHNPAEYNGIKIIVEEGKDARVEDTKRIEEIIETIDKFKYITFEEGIKDRKIEIINPFNDYIDTIIKMINVNAIRDKNLNIILDTMFGVCKSTLLTILLTSRCNVEVLHDNRDTLFGGRLPTPTSHTLGKLQRKVIENNVDLGIATDGDADRLGIVCNQGEFIHPNEIMSVIYYYLLKYKGWRGPAVRNVATTHLIDKIAKSFGEKCYEVPVGFKYISGKMEEVNALIGGESSGGLTIRGHIKGKDGIFAAALLVEALCVTDMSVHDLLRKIHEIYGEVIFKEANLKFESKRKESLKNKIYVNKELPKMPYEVEKVSYLDGVKIYFKDGGWISTRFSGTEPVLRIFAEMDKKEKCLKVIEVFKEFLEL
ncbi:phosphoglucomutase/phosphomannomutase family protein [Clostridium ganghwense]|uniref:Phosphoglucomutase n=1 Tax=Clostridium ganghwense TaxID=312089 RepID=A0ABT4CQM6_9CLOT|nr:phosphoglucomutase/phosphomannomutase family protein [Clostridium ganghwense]MCY6371360.1 phosphoglucomutase/phosphomannomutase family protein [Clostridium ganghwense]